MDLIKLIATVAEAFLKSSSSTGPVGSNPELAIGDTIFDRPKSANFKCPDASIEKGCEILKNMMLSKSSVRFHS